MSTYLILLFSAAFSVFVKLKSACTKLMCLPGGLTAFSATKTSAMLNCWKNILISILSRALDNEGCFLFSESGALLMSSWASCLYSSARAWMASGCEKNMSEKKCKTLENSSDKWQEHYSKYSNNDSLEKSVVKIQTVQKVLFLTCLTEKWNFVCLTKLPADKNQILPGTTRNSPTSLQAYW